MREPAIELDEEHLILALDAGKVGVRQRLHCLAVATLFILPLLAFADQQGEGIPSQHSTIDAPAWAYSVTGMYFVQPDDSNYPLGIARADRDQLHLEARYNYEALNTGSLFAGWTFSGGGSLTYELTPMLGAVFGATQGIAPGFEVSLLYGIVDYYIEAEYLYDFGIDEDNYFYAWSELGISPLKWLRFGLVGQRMRIYSSDRDIDRGGFAEFMFGKTAFGFYLFNPDDSANRFPVVSLEVDF